MKNIRKRRFWISSLLAWIVFVAIDFLMHASILAGMWLKEQPAFKPLDELTLLVPAGYGSFYLLTIFVGWIYTSIYSTKQDFGKALGFGLIFGFLFVGSNALGMYSYLLINPADIIMVNLVYMVEVVSVVLIFRYLFYEDSIGKRATVIVLMAFAGFIIGVAIQNILNIYS